MSPTPPPPTPSRVTDTIEIGDPETFSFRFVVADDLGKQIVAGNGREQIVQQIRERPLAALRFVSEHADHVAAVSVPFARPVMPSREQVERTEAGVVPRARAISAEDEPPCFIRRRRTMAESL
jgi:hypothetical protein